MDTNIRRYQQDDGLRVYVDDNSGRKGLSVTTYLSRLEEDTTALDYWKDNNDGDGDAADWEELLKYSQDRGTLCHAAALSEVSDEEIWTDDEQDSLEDIRSAGAERHYSVLKNKGKCYSWDEYNMLHADGDLEDVYFVDEAYFMGVFLEYCHQLGINEDTIVCTEEYILHYDTEYDSVFGGQLDLLYYDEETDEHVLADLKTSSGLYHDKKLQVAAYAKAAEAAPHIPVDTVDRVEVIRISADKDHYDVHSNVERSDFHSTVDWPEEDTIDALYTEFGELMQSVDTNRLIK